MMKAIARWLVGMAHRFETAVELLGFVGSRRPWLVPLLMVLLLLSGFVMLAQATQIAPFIYTIF